MGNHYPHPADDEVHLWTAALHRPPDQVDRIALALPESEQIRAAQFALPAPRQQFIVGRSVLRSILSAYLGTSPSSIRFDYGDQGKPTLVSPLASLHFNLSHSNGLLAVALATHRPVGVDLEQVRPVPQASDMADRYFTEAERRELHGVQQDADAQPNAGAQPNADAQPIAMEAFFRLWTCKEALVKASGVGISGAWTEVEVSAVVQGKARVARFGQSLTPWSINVLTPVPGFVAAIAVPGSSLNIRHTPWADGLHPSEVVANAH